MLPPVCTNDAFLPETGIGLAEQSYGGTDTYHYMGLTQGSGAAPAAWTAISTVMVLAYTEQGHGARFASGWSGNIFAKAALLYVDNTDLLHMCYDHILSEVEFVDQVQLATYYWAKLLQAMGGNLKPAKCYWYLMSYKFVKGVVLLKPLHDIRHHSVTIPQLTGGMWK